MSHGIHNGKWNYQTGGDKLKRFFCIQLAIIIVAIITSIFAKKLIPNYNIVCKDVERIPFNSLLVLSDISMQDMYQDGQNHISEMRNDAIENNYTFTVAAIESNDIRLISNGNVVISCKVYSVLEGDKELNGKYINVFLPYSESFYFQSESDMEDFIQSLPPEISSSQDSLIEVAKNVSCFCYSKKNIPLSEHKYLAFLKSCQLSESSQEYFFFMDYYDLTNSQSIPIEEGCLGQYKDYSDNEVFFSSQDDIDQYYSLKEQVISTFLNN